MAPPSRGSSSVDQQLGRLAEAVENSKEERSDMARRMDVGMERLTGEVRGLTQTVQSTANQVANLINQDLGSRMKALEMTVNGYDSKLLRYDQDNCSGRIRVLEDDLRYYRAVIGTGWGILWRVGGFILGSATVAAFVQQFFHKLTGG